MGKEKRNEVRALLERIGADDLCAALVGEGKNFELNEAGRYLLAYIAALERRIEQLETGLKETSRRWRIIMLERTNAVFMDDTGRIARMPLNVVALIGQRKPLDVEVKDHATTLLLIKDGEPIAEIPKSLVEQLPRICKEAQACLASS